MFALLLTEGMNPFYQNISSFPTAIYTFFLLLIVLYWLVAMLGFIEIDILDFDLPDADGEINVNAHSELSNPDVLAGLMLKFGLNGVPVTIIISFIALFGWLLAYYSTHIVFGFLPEGVLRYIAGVPIFLATFYIAVLLTAQIIKPMRSLFKNTQQIDKIILGQTVSVRSSRVDNSFGEAIFNDGGAGILLKIRTTDDSVFKQGDKVVLLEHIKQDNHYLVVSEQEFSGV